MVKIWLKPPPMEGTALSPPRGRPGAEDAGLKVRKFKGLRS